MTGNPIKSTIYYYRFGVLSSLGQYSGIFLQIFSDSARTTLVTTAVKAKAASACVWRYYLPMQSDNVAGTSTLTLSHQDVTISANALSAGDDLTGFTLVGSHLVAWPDCAIATLLQTNEVSYLYRDDGAAAYAGNFTPISGMFDFVTRSASTSKFNFLGIANAATHGADLTTDQFGLIYQYVSSAHRIYFREITGGVEYISTGFVTIVSSVFWIDIRRDITVGTYGTAYIDVWQDPAKSIRLGSQIVHALHANVDYQFAMPLQSRNSGVAATSTFTLGGVVYPVAAPSSYSITSDGGAVAGGSSTIKRGRKVLASGGAVAGGSSTILLGQKVIATGGGVLGGTASQYGTYFGTASYSITSSGGMVAGGSSIIKRGLKVSSTGGMVAGGSATISVSYAPGLSEYIYTEVVVDSSGTPITGASSKTSIFLKNVGTGYIMDWSDVTMKSSGWGSTTDVLSEAIYPAGEYGYNVPLSGLSNGRYCATLKYTPTTPSSSDPIQTFQIEFYVVGGYIVDQYTSGVVATLPSAAANAAAVGARIIEGALTADEVERIKLAALAGKRSGLQPSSPTEKYWSQDGTKERIVLGKFMENFMGQLVGSNIRSCKKIGRRRPE